VFFEVEVFNYFAAAQYCCCGEVRGWTSYQNHIITPYETLPGVVGEKERVNKTTASIGASR
jgi:hypothetical protein